MNKAKLLLNTAKKFCVKNAPSILTIIGVGTSITSVGLAIKMTPEAQKAIEVAKDNKLKDKDGNYIANKENYDNHLNPWEYVKAVAPVMWPVAVTEVTSVACVICANSVNLKRQAALLAAYSLSETSLAEYKNKVKETFGKEANEIENKIVADKVANTPVDETSVIQTGKGTNLILDYTSGRYFYSSIEQVGQAINRINARLLKEIQVPLNDLYIELGLPTIAAGEMLGWNGTDFDDQIDPQNITTTITPDGRPCLVLNLDPKYINIYD